MSEFSAETLYQFETITSNVLSPDGQHIAYGVKRVDRKTEKKPIDLWVVATDGQSKPRRFTWSDSVEAYPQWSPDGQSIAFVSNRGDGKQMQLYVLPFHGGEARPLTKASGSLSVYDWSPDGSKIAVIHRGKDEDAVEREKDPQKKKLGIVAHHITTATYKYDGIGFLPKSRAHIWIIDVESGEMQQLTTGDFNISNLAWSPDGEQIALTANVNSDTGMHTDQDEIYTVSATIGDEPHGVDSFTQVTSGGGGITLMAYSPDGSQIAYFGNPMIGNWWQNTECFVVPATGGDSRSLTAAHDVYVGSSSVNDVPGGTPSLSPAWSADGQRIRFQVSRHGNQPLMQVNVATGELSTVIEANTIIGIAHTDRDEQVFGYMQATMSDPCQLFAKRGDEIVQLTQLNSWLADVPQCAVEEVWFESKDGYKVQGWIMTPPNFDPSQTYPSIMEIHGGPQAQYANFYMHEFYYLASQGYVVYFSNPRGGQGYGNAHCKAIHGQWGTVDFDDLMAWADYMEAQPYIDKSRMGVTGGSYGGLMTSMIIGRTNRFTAAAAQRSVTNWISMYGTADFNMDWEMLCGDPAPWVDIETNWKHSPISYIGNATTPTLIIHSLNDFRTNFEQSELLYVALKKLGIDTEMVVFPGESHGLSRTGRTDRRIARLEHIARWFNKYLK